MRSVRGLGPSSSPLSLRWLRPLHCLAALAPLLALASPAAAQRDGMEPVRTWSLVANSDSVGQYGFRTTSNNRLNVTITNSGGWGVGYTSSVVPNFSYPAGLSFEHMVRGGLWIGVCWAMLA